MGSESYATLFTMLSTIDKNKRRFYSMTLVIPTVREKGSFILRIVENVVTGVPVISHNATG